LESGTQHPLPLSLSSLGRELRLVRANGPLAKVLVEATKLRLTCENAYPKVLVDIRLFP